MASSSPEVSHDSEVPLVNGHLDETQLQRKLSLLSPVPDKHLPLYLGDDDHPGRALIRDAISPSPRQDERRRAEEMRNGRRLFFRPVANLVIADHCPYERNGQCLFIRP